MTNVHVTVTGAKELRQAFRKFGQDVDGKRPTRRLTMAYKSISEWVANESRSRARGGLPMQEKMAAGIKGSASVSRGAQIKVTNTSSTPAAVAAVWGQKKRSGWFGTKKFKDYSGQTQGFLPWVGASWKVGVRGEGPYFINETIADNSDRIVGDLRDAIAAAARDVGFTVQ